MNSDKARGRSRQAVSSKARIESNTDSSLKLHTRCLDGQEDEDTHRSDQMAPGAAIPRVTRRNTMEEQQQQPTPSGRVARSKYDPAQPHAASADVVLLEPIDSGDETDSEAETSEPADDDSSDSDSGQKAAEPQQQRRQRRRTPSVAAKQQQLIVSSDSEGDASRQQSHATSSDTADTSDEEDDLQPFQSTRATSRSARKAPHKEAAASGTITPRRNKASTTTAAAAAAAVTPHSTRSTTAAPAATPRSSKPAAAAVTPLSRPMRSCRQHQEATQQQPSLATPLAKLSLTQHKKAVTPSSKAAASSKKGRQKSSSSNSSGPAVGDVLPHVVVDNEIFLRGDDVYLIQDEYVDVSDEEDEACEVCGSSSMKRGNPILECSTCLRGFHLRCLKPPLKKVPDADWFCSDCNAGRQPPPPSRLIARWQKLLYGKNELVLVNIVGCQRGRAPDGSEEDQMLVRYYMLPQDTHVGRQQDHGAREVFLGTQTYVEPAHAIAGRAHVFPPSQFGDAGDDEGNDVFLCEFEYDEAWKRFRRRRYTGSRDTTGQEIMPTTPGGPGYSDGAVAMAGRGSHQHVSGSAAGVAQFDESGLAGDSSDNDTDSEQDESYRPELRFARTPGTIIKRKRHGQLLPAEAQAAAAVADKFAGLGASDIGRQRQEVRDAFGRLHAALSLAAVPSSLPCRDQERTRLKGFVKRALHEDGGILYICGVPGTGKTALVMELLAGMRDEAVKAGSQFVAINCLQLPSPQHVFSRLWEKLSGQHLGPARARDALMQLFNVAGGGSGRRKYSTIIVLDEIDMLMTRDQAVLYQLFDWPNQPGSRLGIIGISNTHDLDQRVLPRIASRLDQAKLAFAPYSVAQLQEIVKGRLDASGVAAAVEDSAVQLACRKVASETGDVRRALEMLRRAVEIGRQQKIRLDIATEAATSRNATQQQSKQLRVYEWKQGEASLVKRQHLQVAQSEMFSALHHQLLRSRSQWEKVMLAAVVVEARATGRTAVVIQNVCERASNSLAALVNLQPPSLGVLQHVLVKLASMRLLLSDGAHIKAHVALNVDKDDVALAIKEDERLTRLHQLL